MRFMTPRATNYGATAFGTMIIGTVVALVFAGACSSGGKGATHLVKVADPAPAGPLLLAEFDAGVGAAAETASAPVWMEPGAVAALDGSTVYSIRADELVRIDPRSGAALSSWPLPASARSISAVAPAGRWVALTDRERGYGSQGRAATEVVVFDTRTGAEARRLALKGDVQPEAFSVDGTLLFALDYRVGYYRVQTIQLDSGMRFDTTDRDKTIPPDDMHGTSVHGVMSADRTLLATLYRNPGNKEEPAFVHVLDLEHGWSYCADLPPPFGTGPFGSDTIELTPAGTVVVAATRFDRLAEIHIDDVRTPGNTPVRLALRNGTVVPPAAALQSMPGFEYVIAPLAA
jgi:hypothetical protein